MNIFDLHYRYLFELFFRDFKGVCLKSDPFFIAHLEFPPHPWRVYLAQSHLRAFRSGVVTWLNIAPTYFCQRIFQ